MRTTPKIMALFLALVMALSCVVPVSAAEKSGSTGNLQLTELDEAAQQESSANESAPQPVYDYDENETVRAIILMEDDPLASESDSGFTLLGLFSKKPTESDLLESHERLREEMSQAGIDYTLNFDYTTLLNGMAVTVAYGALDAIAEMDGVASVHVVNTYEQTPEIDVQQMGTANTLTGAADLYSAGYKGTGMVIAVIDSGITSTHEAFTTAPSTATLTTSTTTTCGHGKYVSTKIPYFYDYYEATYNSTNGTTVTDAGGHGTHVAGIAAGNNGSTFRGAAPDAQLVIMKVFATDTSYTATDTSILVQALEDAYKLGVDVINMSIGFYSGFTVDYDLESVMNGVYTNLENAGIVCCISAGNYYSIGDWYGTRDPWVYADYSDYGTICTPSIYEGPIAVAAASNSAGSGDPMLPMSSWGATPNLEIGPEITAIGGGVSSAKYNTTSEYTTMSGTSMASPDLAGNMAVVLQYLKETYPSLSKKERADRAEALVKSTAITQTTAKGTIYSPRKQGAGLVNIVDATSAKAYITDPIHNLYDNESGAFSFSFTVQNLTDTAQTYSVDLDVLTDHVADGIRDLTSDKLTEGTDYTNSGDQSVTVPANGTATVNVSIQLSAAKVSEFASYGGNFVEGFVRLANSDEEEIHATYMGFCGDWAAYPILEKYDWRDFYNGVDTRVNTKENWVYAGTVSTDSWGYVTLGDHVDAGENYYYQNLYSSDVLTDWNYSDDRIAISSSGSYNKALYIMQRNIRNARSMVMVVTDPAGSTVYYSAALTDPYYTDITEVKKVYYDFTDWINYNFAYFTYSGAKTSGTLSNGTEFVVNIYATLDYDNQPDLSGVTWNTTALNTYKDYLAWSFPCTIDTTAPSANTSNMYYDSGTSTLYVPVSDNQYVACAELYNGSTIIDHALFFGEEGETCVAAFDVSGISTSTSLTLKIYDYATNSASTTLRLSSATAHTAHSWSDWEITQEATETRDGIRSRTCSVCGVKESQTVKLVTLDVGGNKSYTAEYADNYADGYTSDDLDSSIASVSVTSELLPSETIAAKSDAATTGSSFLISDGNGHYLTASGTSVSSTTDIASATSWSIVDSGYTGYFYITTKSGNTTYYLYYNSGSIGMGTSTAYWIYNANIGLYTYDTSSTSTFYYLYYNGSKWTFSAGNDTTTGNNGALYSAVTLAQRYGHTITITGNANGETAAVVGTTYYDIRVGGPAQKVALNVGESTTITDDSGNYADNVDRSELNTAIASVEVTGSGSSTHIAITGVGEGTTSVTVGGIIYTITVAMKTENVTVYIDDGKTVTDVTGNYADKVDTTGLDTSIATVSVIGSGGSTAITITGVSMGATSVIVGNTKYNITVKDPALAAEKTEYVTLKVGESATYTDNAHNYEDDVDRDGLNDTVATVTVEGTTVPGGTITTTTKLTAISSGTTLVIGDGNGNYIKCSGASIGTTTDVDEATVWTVGTQGNAGYFNLLDDEGYYLCARTGTNTSAGNYTYTLNAAKTSGSSNFRRWSYSEESGFYYSGYYLTYENGSWTLTTDSSSGNGAAYSLGTGTADPEYSTTITITGEAPGKTYVIVGDTCYVITVTDGGTLTTKDVTVTAGESKTVTDATGNYANQVDRDGLDTDIATVTVTGSDDGTTIVINGVAEGETSVTVGNTIYNIKVEAAAPVLTTKDVTVTAGESETVTDAAGNYADQVDTTKLNTDVATVTVTGTGTSTTIVITGVAEGETSVTVGNTVYNIKVEAAAPVLTTKDVTVTAGESKTVTDATGNYADQVDTTKLNTDVATVTVTGTGTSTTIVITGVAEGETSVTVGNTVYNIIVEAAAPVLTTKDVTVTVGESETIEDATGNYADKVDTTDLETGVATVAVTGTGTSTTIVITGVAEGETSVTVGNTIYNITVKAPALAAEQTEYVTLKVGESTTYTDNAHNYEDEVDRDGLNPDIAGVTVEGTTVPGGTITTATKLTGLTKGATLVIGDGNGNYIKRSGASIGTTTNVDEATVWTVGTQTSSGVSYFNLKDDEGYYLRSRSATSTYALNVSNATTSTAFRRWTYDETSGFYYSGYYLSYENGSWTLTTDSSSGNGAAYSLGTGTADPEYSTTITITGVAPGKTYVIVGNTQYVITVEALKAPDVVIDFGLPVTIDLSDTVQNALASGAAGYGTVTVSGTSVTYTPTCVLPEADTVTLTDEAGLIYTFRVIPASNVLYEETFLTQVDEEGTAIWTLSDESGITGVQDGTGRYAYGYDPAYAASVGTSGNTATVTVASGISSAVLKASFHGNAIDVIGDAAANTATLLVLVKDGSGKIVKGSLMDTRYCGDAQDVLSQLPLVHLEFAEGDYTVEIRAFYAKAVEISTTTEAALPSPSEAFSTDETTTAANSVIVKDTAGTQAVIDGFRVYRSTDDDAYAAAEQNVTYTDVLELVEGEFAAYVEGGVTGTWDAATYRDSGGPENEIYLNANTAIALQLTGVSEGETVQISARAVTNTPANLNGDQVIDSNTEMYYNVEVSENGVVVITNTGAGMLSIGKLKLPVSVEALHLPAGGGVLQGVLDVINQTLGSCTDATAAAGEPEASEEPEALEEPETSEEPEALEEPEASEEPEALEEPETLEEPEALEEPETSEELEALEEEEPEIPVFEPEMLDVRVDVRSMGKKAKGSKVITVTITASADVTELTVNGVTIQPINSKSSRRGWNGTYTYVITETVKTTETMTYEIIAYNADGAASEACTVEG